MSKVKDSLHRLLGYGGIDQGGADADNTANPPLRSVENKFMVQPHGDGGILVHHLPVHSMTRVEALEFAAHLVHFTERKYHSNILDAQSELSYFLITLRDIRRQNK